MGGKAKFDLASALWSIDNSGKANVWPLVERRIMV